MEKVIIRGVNWIGDAVMSMPFIEGLGLVWPDTEIHVLTRPHLAELYRYNPYVKNIVILDEKSRVSGWINAIGKIRKTEYKAVICLPHSFSSALFLFLSGIGIRYGRACNGRSMFFTHPVYGRIEDYPGHQSDFYLEMLEAISGWRGEKVLPEIYITDDERKRASLILDKIKRPLLGIFCSAAYGPAKVWPKERFSELGRLYMSETGGSVVLLGGSRDSVINDEIAASTGAGAVNVAGKTNLLETVAIMEKCNAVVANDSGPMHLAAASGTRTIGIFGSTNPVRTAPLGRRAAFITKGLECAPCMARTCRLGTYECLKGITPDEILKEIL